MNAKYWIKENLEKLCQLPPSATDWLLMVWDTIQVFDDVADGDVVERADLNAVIWHTMVAMHQNPFFANHSQTLTPMLASMILKWQASDTAERQGNANAMSFVWRAGYYDVVLMSVTLTHGSDFATKNAHLIMALYGEQLEDYLKEFNHA